LRPPEILETPRLLLRKPIAPDDAPLIYDAYAHDPEVTRYLTWLPHRDREEAERVLDTRVAWWDSETEFSWMITSKAGGTVFGMIAATADSVPWRFSLGYVLGRAHWRRGYMTEAARAVMDTMLGIPGIHRIWAVVDQQNAASIRVLEKVGMQREGLLRRWSLHPAISTVPRDCWCYGKVR
jgi:RimJ/RimL family protein N-acetyltransferase